MIPLAPRGGGGGGGGGGGRPPPPPPPPPAPPPARPARGARGRPRGAIDGHSAVTQHRGQCMVHLT
ncbi:hypothetical protein, partial [Nocardia abscessus]|uniref:hypothetical protein n=1 Tax=Nocardia abscessus TaxID=120957 RepID=UPI0024575CB0